VGSMQRRIQTVERIVRAIELDDVDDADAHIGPDCLIGSRWTMDGLTSAAPKNSERP
jgi:limonene-1,2-epoxide hydrolase